MFSPRHFSIPQNNSGHFREKLIQWAALQENFCLLNSNGYSNQNKYLGGETPDFLLATGIQDALVTTDNEWEALKVFYEKNRGQWIFGHLSYDLKNRVEDLFSAHTDRIHFPLLYFFVPQTIIEVKGSGVSIHAHDAQAVFEKINAVEPPATQKQELVFQQTVNKEHYRLAVENILKHIRYGDVYELNYCIEFFSEKAAISPEEIYRELNKYSPAPFSAFYRLKDKYLISASPERFLAKRGDQLFSQPIKGTIKRGNTKEEDARLINVLQNDEKERSENIMIVDLVRNDLSRSCEPGSVIVDELCGIYTFPHVHQMISTVSGRLMKKVHPVDAIKNAFPMGSMTGAPKVRAMELIEKYELTRRGLYSGAVGYFNPDGDFDFNVVIRSLQYNMTEKYLSVMAGGAITALSDPDKEYEECLLKAEALLKIFESKNDSA